MVDLAVQKPFALFSRRIFPFTLLARQVHRIYRDAFPPHERFSLWFLYKTALLRRSCTFRAWFDLQAQDLQTQQSTGKRWRRFFHKVAAPVGFTFEYRQGDVLFLVLLAVNQRQRSRGYGKRILAQLHPPQAGGVIVLQIEPPDPNVQNAWQRERRRDFYFSAGFRQVPFYSEEAGVPYATLIRGRDLTQAEFVAVLADFAQGEYATRVFLPDV